jgi:HPt (histidine-containing phosphotransfer) domain-containing protein
VPHTLNGVSGNRGADSLYQAAAGLEKAIMEGKNLDLIIAEFDSQLAMVMDGLRVVEERLAAQERPGDSETEVLVDKEAIRTLLQEITQLLDSDMIEAMNRLEALNGHLANSSTCEEFKRLEKQVESFDTDAALETVETIARKLEIEL